MTTNANCKKTLVPATPKEYGLATLKGIISSIPLVGPVAAEIAAVHIPNVQQERIVKVLAYFGEKVSGLEAEFIQSRMNQDDFKSLFEDAIKSAANAKTEERLSAIAQTLKDGLSEPSEVKSAKRHLFILGRLSDEDVSNAIILAHRIDPEDYENWTEESEVVSLISRVGYVIASPEDITTNQEIVLSLNRLSQEHVLERQSPVHSAVRVTEYSDGFDQIQYRVAILGMEFLGYLRRSTDGVLTDDTMPDDTDYLAEDFKFA